MKLPKSGITDLIAISEEMQRLRASNARLLAEHSTCDRCHEMDELREQIIHLKANNAQLLGALRELSEIRHRQWAEMAKLQFVEGRTLLPWPEVIRANAAIAEAERLLCES